MSTASILYKQVKGYIVQKWQHVDLVNVSLILKTRGPHRHVVIQLVTQMWLMFLYDNINK